MSDFKTKIDNLTDRYALARIGELILIEHKGFKNWENMAQKVPTMLRGKISKVLKTSKVSDIDSEEGYKKLWDGPKSLFWRAIFSDLYQENHAKTVELFLLGNVDELGEKELIEFMFNDNNEEEQIVVETEKEELSQEKTNAVLIADDEFEDTEKFHALQKENQALKKEISRLTKRMEKNINGYHVLSETKDKLEAQHNELINKYNELDKKFSLLKTSLSSSVVLDKRKEEYYNKLFAAQNILMVNMKPKTGVPFPFSYNYVSIKTVFKDNLQDINVSDVWLVKGYYSDIQVEAIISKLESRYGTLNFREISQEQINLMELEVEQ